MGLDQTAYIEKDDGSGGGSWDWRNLRSLDDWMADLFVKKDKDYKNLYDNYKKKLLEERAKAEAEKENSGNCLCRDCIEEIPFSVAECPHCKSKDIPKKVTCWNCKESFSEDDIESDWHDICGACPFCDLPMSLSNSAIDMLWAKSNEGFFPMFKIELNEENLDELSKFVESDPDFKQEADYNCPNGRMESVKQFIKEAKAALGKGHKVFYHRSD